MCSCSGSCNCNSTTIPKGPAGPQGPQGIKGATGADGFDGTNGTNGIDSFTTLIQSFTQPQAANNPANPTAIYVANTAWIAIDQIIYISYDASNIGGYYRVIGKNMNGNLNAVNVIRLSWTIPGVNFVVNPATVLTGSSVTPAGTKGVDGQSITGNPGTNGINAYTTVQNQFTQRVVGVQFTITVNNNTWIGTGQIIYISSAGFGIGGFYQVNSKSGTNNLTITRLDWALPNITFIEPPDVIFAGSFVSASGSRGVDGGTNGLSWIIDSFWGDVDGAGLTGKTLRSIGVPVNTLTTDDDVLECQTIYKTAVQESNAGNAYYVKITNANALSGIVGPDVAFSNYFPAEGVGPYTYIHMRYKIQRINNTTFRCVGDVLCSDNIISVSTALTNAEIITSFMNVSPIDFTLNGTSTWGNIQYVAAICDDPSNTISLIHHEVKVVKKKV